MGSRSSAHQNARFTQLEQGRWRAEYTGFVTMTAEGDTPTESERHLSRAMDVLLAGLIRGGKDREKPDTVAAISSLMLSDAIAVVNNTAKKTARFKQARHQAFSGKPEETEETADPAEVKEPRKRR